MACGDVCPKGCILFPEGKDGFWYPQIDSDACIHCQSCQRACPVLTPVSFTKRLPKAYAAWVGKDARKESASGGAFYAMADAVIHKGGYVAGAVFDGYNVKHILTNDLSELTLIQGTKYFQSNTSCIYHQIKKLLLDGKIVLFGGTSCQVAGLLNVLGKKRDHLITVDLICYGVPSFLTINVEEKIRGKKLKRILSNRDKNHPGGWRNCYYMTCEWEDGSKTVSAPHESFMLGAFNSGKAMRMSCYHCLYKKLERPSDISIGDYHNVKGLDEEKNDGISLVLTHTDKGEKFLQDINLLSVHERPLTECLKGKRTIFYNDTMYASHPMRRLMPWMFKHAPIWLLKITYQGFVKSKNPLVWPFSVFDLVYREVNKKKANQKLKEVLNQIS